MSFLGICLLGLGLLQAQLSPGDLSEAHAHLEGISNCTACHDLGNKVTNQKCLECHEDIQSLLTQNKGYHAHSSVRNQDCFECHSEHHGRRFDALRFDQDEFDHLLTGYELEGAHDRIDCRECHKPDYIADPDIRKRENTFLGLGQECLDCHTDYHQETLPTDCRSCHEMEAWSPASLFDHDETDYPLAGAHREVECIECHRGTIRNGQEFQEFSGIRFNDCIDCHDDPHESRIAGACAQCHSVQSFTRFIGQRRFNHNTTDFALRGAHQTTDCFECHDRTSNPLTVFGDQTETNEDNCISCHEDYHEGKYGPACVDCHQESSFLDLKDMSFFDHTVADFQLEGLHLGVDCRECHTTRFSDAIAFNECRNCHEDYHEGEFESIAGNPDCESCHTVDHGFDYSMYSLEQHQETSFPLEGAHMATPCFACHLDEREERWTFRNIGNTCVDCHDNIHEGYISESYYPENECVACHGQDAWSAVAFDHDQTDWPLTGQHALADCRDCHFEVLDDLTLTEQAFISLGTDCVTCHENVHGDEFEIDGVTDCTRCHGTNSWFPEVFDHNTTRFPLDGRHAEIDCMACHAVEQEDGTSLVIYQIERFECADCHN